MSNIIDTYQHKTRTLARRAAESAGLNLDDLVILQNGESKLWGWENAEEHAKACEAADRPKRGKSRNAEAPGKVETAAPDTGLLAVDMPEATADAGVTVPDETVGLDVQSAIDAMPAAAHTGLVTVGDTTFDVTDPATGALYVSPIQADMHTIPVGMDVPLLTGPVIDGETVDLLTGEVMPEGPASDSGEYEPEPTAVGDRSKVVNLTPPAPADSEVVVQIAGGMLPVAARVLAAQLMKRYGMTVLLRDATTLDLRETIAPKQRSSGGGHAGGPRVVRDWSVRPVINSKHHLHVEKILDRIDDAAGDVGALETILTTFKPSCTYYKMAHRYGMAKLEEAREAEANGETETPPGIEITLAEAAD